MSLLRLLTAGKSLVGLRKDDGRYHLPSERSLPRFGSKKNPFRATVFPEKAEPGAPEECPAGQGTPVPEKAVEAPAPQPVISASEPGAASHRLNCCSPCEAKEAPVAEPSAPRSGFRAFLLWRKARKPRTSGLWTGRPMVQGELSLDSVKVVRNDLSDSDLEVVPTREKPAEKSAQLSKSESKRNSPAGGTDLNLACEPLVSSAEM